MEPEDAMNRMKGYPEKTELAECSVEDDEFMRKIVAAEEQRRHFYPHIKWVPGQYRWFESPNIIDLWQRYSATERAAISQRLQRQTHLK